MVTSRKFKVLIFILLWSLTVVSSAAGAQMHPVAGNTEQSPTDAGEEKANKNREEENLKYFSDLKVMTHEGRELRFYSDLLRDRIVVISFFFTTCPTAQPSIVTLFRVQKMLGDKLGNEVLLLTISVDPQKDDLKAVQDHAKNFNPRKGWLFITGSAENMEIINRRLGNTLRLPEGHLRLFLMGNLKTGHWMKIPDTAPAVSVVEGIRSLGGE